MDIMTVKLLVAAAMFFAVGLIFGRFAFLNSYTDGNLEISEEEIDDETSQKTYKFHFNEDIEKLDTKKFVHLRVVKKL